MKNKFCYWPYTLVLPRHDRSDSNTRKSQRAKHGKLVSVLSPLNHCGLYQGWADFHEEKYSWKDQSGRNKTGRTKWESRELSGGFMDWNTIERAIKTERSTRTEVRRSGQARLVYIRDINRSIPATWRWARGDKQNLAKPSKTSNIREILQKSTAGVAVCCVTLWHCFHWQT